MASVAQDRTVFGNHLIPAPARAARELVELAQPAADQRVPGGKAAQDMGLRPGIGLIPTIKRVIVRPRE